MDTFKERFAQIIRLAYRTNLEAYYRYEISGAAQMGRYLKGTGLPSADVLTAIANTGVSINWLLTAKGPMFIDTEEGHALAERIARRFIDGELEMELCPPDIKAVIEAGVHTNEGAAAGVGSVQDDMDKFTSSEDGGTGRRSRRGAAPKTEGHTDRKAKTQKGRSKNG